MATQLTLNDGSLNSAGSLLLKTNGTTTAVTIDTSQNLGLGVTPSAWDSSIFTPLQIRGASFFAGINSPSDAWVGSNFYYGSGAYKYIATGGASYYRQASGEHYWGRAGSGTAGNAISFTQAMTLDSSGNLGINKTSLTSGVRLQVVATDATYGATFAGASNAVRISTANSGVASVEGTDATGSASYQALQVGGSLLQFTISGSEKARIDSSGNLLVGTTFLSNTERLNVTFPGSSKVGLSVDDTSATSCSVMIIRNNGTICGSISKTTTATAYNTSSDYRLKHDIAPMTGALNKVTALKPVTYKWNADNSDGQGFIAHELAEVCPDAVHGVKDAVETYIDAEGNEQTRPVYQGIDTSFLVATLTAAIQELNAKFEAYKAAHP